MSHKFQGAVLVMVLTLMLSGSSNAQLGAYPEWFLYPAKYPGVHTGLTYKGNTALEDALIMAASFQWCLVDGILRVISKEDVLFPHRQTDYFYYYPEEVYQSLKGTLIPLDSLVTNTIRLESIVAFARDSSVKVPGTRIRSAGLAPPGWLNHGVVLKNGYYYSSASFTAKGNENDSWRTAEERAIFAILLTLDLEVNSSTTTDNTVHKADEFMKVIEFKVKKKLRDISVLERYPDLQGRQNHVLLRLKID